MAGRFVYRGQDRSVESVVKKSKQAGGLYDNWINPDIPVLKVREGQVALRIMPPTWLYDDQGKIIQENLEKWGDGWEVQVFVHSNVGPDNNTYLCLEKMKGQPCPVCEARAATNDADEADALRPGWKAVAYVIDRDAEKAGPQAWVVPITLFRDINARSIDKKSGKALCIDDPDKGFDLLFNREGQKLKTKYLAVDVERVSTNLGPTDEKQDRWLDFAQDHPLPSILNFYDYDHIAKVLAGKKRKKNEDDGDEPRRIGRRGRDEEEEERPGRRRLAREEDDRPARRATVEDDERPARRAAADDDERPSRRRAAEEDERPSSRRRAAEEDERPSSRRREAEDERPSRRAEADDERPSRRRSEEDEDVRSARRREEDDGERPARRRLIEDKTDDKGKDKEDDRPRRAASEDAPSRGNGKDDGDKGDEPEASRTARGRLDDLKSRRAD